MGQKDILHVDTQGAEELLMLEQIRRVLGLSSLQEFSVLRWNSPKRILPQNITYVLVKQYEFGLGPVCSRASFEGGEFWALPAEPPNKIPRETILAWCYPPYDGRTTPTGRLKD